MLIVPGWTESDPAQFQVQLIDPNGVVVVTANQIQRSQVVRFRPIKPGTYTLRIDALAGQGPYFVDLSCDGTTASTQAAKR